jgi:exosortase
MIPRLAHPETAPACSRGVTGISALSCTPALYAALCMTLVLYAPTTLILLRTWNAFGSEYYTHGDLIAGLVVLALIARRRVLAQTPWAPRPLALPTLLLLSLAWLIAYQSTIQVAHEAMLPLVLIAMVYALFGRAAAAHCAFPIGFLYFAIPVWQWCIPSLQRLTIAVMGIALPLVGIPADITGDVVQIPAGNFLIQGGCAGAAYLLVALAVAAYCGDAWRESARRRLGLLLLAGVCAIVSNWVRVFTVIVAGQLTHMQSYLVRVSHNSFGWLVFGVCMVTFTALARWLFPARPAAGPSLTRAEHRSTATPYLVPKAALAVLVAGVGPAWAAIIEHRSLPPVSQLLRPASGWNGPYAYVGSWHPSYTRADLEELGTYRMAAGEVSVYLAQYARQSDSSKLQSVANEWTDTSETALVRPAQRRKQVSELEVIDSGGRHSVLLSGYAVGNLATASVVDAQLAYGWSALFGSPPVRAFAVRAACAPDCEAARARALAFLDANDWLTTGTRLTAP